MAKASRAERPADLFGGADPFRLVIRGHALIDERLDELLAYAYVGERPPFLRGPSFQRKVDLCVALGLMSSPSASLVNRLTKLRNEIAHGGDEVTTRRVKVVYSAAHELQPSLADLSDVFPRSDDPHDLLAVTLAVIWAGLDGCEMVAAKRREETLKDLETRWTEAAELGVMLFQADLTSGEGTGSGLRRMSSAARCQARGAAARSTWLRPYWRVS
jgi:hypothetical protein